MSAQLSVSGASTRTTISLSRWLLGGAVLLTLLMLFLVSYFLYLSYQNAEQLATIRTQNLANALDGDLANLIGKSEVAIFAIAEEYKQQVAAGPVNEAALTAFMTQMNERLVEIDYMRATDTEGIIRYGQGIPPGSEVDVSDREYFIHCRDNPDENIYIAKPVQARITKKWVLPIVLRLNRPDNSFGGVVFASLNLDRITQKFSSINVGEKGVVTLLDNSPAVITRSPEPAGGIEAAVGKKVTSPYISRLLTSEETSATFKTRSVIDNVKRLFTVQKISAFPLYLAVGLATSEYLSSWWKEAFDTIGLFVLFITVLFFATTKVIRSWNERAGYLQTLCEREENLLKVMREQQIILENANIGISLIIDRKHVWVNKKIEELFQYPKEELVGQTTQELYNSLEAYEQMSRDAYPVLAQGLTYQTEQKLVRRDGTQILIKCNGKAIDPPDMSKGTLWLLEDITEQKQAEEALRNAHNELEQRVQERTLELQKTHEQLLHAEKMGAIGNLSASIAHEFNNPLQGVMSVIQGVKKRGQFSKSDQELLDLAITECNRMRDLIKSLQDFNRPTSGRKAPVNIHAALDSILLLGKKQFQTRNITVEKKYTESLPQIMAVADQLKQVFLNLLNNASDACLQGGDITIETDTMGDNVVIRIHDTGCGITAENIEHIFEPFFTTKAAMKGTGLGLPVSYGIIKGHGGKITVESQPGEGATFSVILPIEGNSGAEQ